VQLAALWDDRQGKLLDATVRGENIALGKLFADYVVGIETGDLLAPRIVYAHGEHRYCTNADLYGAGHPPDSMVAGALAWRAGTQGGARGYRSDLAEGLRDLAGAGILDGLT